MALAATVAAEGRLEILSDRFDFGTIPYNSTVTHSFYFKSVGTDTLRIKAIKSGCQCTTMPLDQKSLAPGDSMLVGVAWNVGRRMGASTQSPRVFIENNPNPIYVNLVGLVVAQPDETRPVSVRPYKATLAKATTITVDSIEINLTNHSDSDLAVSVISRPSPNYDYSFPDRIEAGTTAVGYVKLNPVASDLEFKSSITLEFEGRKKSRLTIPVLRKIYK